MTNKFKKLALLCLTLCMVVSTGVATAGCVSPDDSSSSSSSSAPDSSVETPVEKNYTFSVVDNNDEAVLGAKIVVKKNGTTVKELLTDSTGTVTATLQTGSVVSVENLPLGYSCGGEKTLTALVTEIEFKLSKDYIDPLSGDGGEWSRYEIALPKDSSGKELDEGTYLVNVDAANKEVFFSFDPSRTGTYRITSLGSLDAKLNGYDASSATLYRNELKDSDNVSDTDKNFVHPFEVTEAYLYKYEDNNVDGSYTEDEKTENTEHRYTFALTLNDGATGSYLFKVEYVSEDTLTPDIEYVTENKQASVTVNQFTAPTDKTLVAAPYNYYDDLVFNATDGYYHAKSENGPIAVVKLTGEQERLLRGGTLESAAAQDPTVFQFTSNVEYDGNGYPVKVTKLDYTNMVLTTYASKVDENGMYPLTKDLHEFLYNYIAVAGNDVNIVLPEGLDTSVTVDGWSAKCMAPVYLYCADNEIPEEETVYVPDGTYDKPYIIDSLGTYNYALTGFGGAKVHENLEWHKYVVTKTGNLKILTENDAAEIEITNKTTNETKTIDGEGSVTLSVTEGDEIYFKIYCSGDGGLETVSLVLSIADPSAEANGSAENPYIINGVGEYEVSLEYFLSMFYKSKWFTFTPTETGTYKFYSEACPLGTYAIYTQASVSSDSIAHSGQEEFQDKAYSYVTAKLTAGTTYYIYVGGNSEASPKPDVLTFKFKVELSDEETGDNEETGGNEGTGGEDVTLEGEGTSESPYVLKEGANKEITIAAGDGVVSYTSFTVAEENASQKYVVSIVASDNAVLTWYDWWSSTSITNGQSFKVTPGYGVMFELTSTDGKEATVTITITKYVPPAGAGGTIDSPQVLTATGEYTAIVPQFFDAYYSFTATEAGWLVGSGEGNSFAFGEIVSSNWGNEFQAKSKKVGDVYCIEVAVGDTVIIQVGSLDPYLSDVETKWSFSLQSEKPVDNSPGSENNPQALTVDTATTLTVDMEGVKYFTFTGEATKTYHLVNESNSSISLTVNGNAVEGSVIELKGSATYTIVATNSSSWYEQDCVLTVDDDFDTTPGATKYFPLELTAGDNTVVVEAGKTVYYTFKASSYSAAYNVTFDASVTVNVGGTDYTESFLLSGSSNYAIAVSAAANANFTLNIAAAPGSQDNPIVIETLGVEQTVTLTTAWYKYTVPANAPAYIEWNSTTIYSYSFGIYVNTQTGESSNDYVAVKEGDVVYVNVNYSVDCTFTLSAVDAPKGTTAATAIEQALETDGTYFSNNNKASIFYKLTGADATATYTITISTEYADGKAQIVYNGVTYNAGDTVTLTGATEYVLEFKISDGSTSYVSYSVSYTAAA